MDSKMMKEKARLDYLNSINESMHILIASPKVGWVLLEDDSGCWTNIGDDDRDAMKIISYMKTVCIYEYCCMTLKSVSHPEGTLWLLYKN